MLSISMCTRFWLASARSALDPDSFMRATLCFAQKDPGVRGGPPGAPGPLSGLTQNELALFIEGKLRTTQLEAVCDNCSDVTLGSDTGLAIVGVSFFVAAGLALMLPEKSARLRAVESEHSHA
jgi:hypothetical protein